MSRGSKQPGETKHINLYGLLSLAGVASPIIFLATNLIAGFFAYPEYNFIRDPVSNLHWTPLGWVYTIGLIIVGLLIEAFILGLILSVREDCIELDWKFRLGAYILLLFGFMLLFTGAFPTDPPDGPKTVIGLIHSITGIAMPFLFPIAGLLFASCFKKQPYWKNIYLYTITTSIISLVLLLGVIWLPSEESRFGLYQRIIIFSQLIWIQVMAIKLLRLSLHQTENKMSSLKL